MRAISFRLTQPWQALYSPHSSIYMYQPSLRANTQHTVHVPVPCRIFAHVLAELEHLHVVSSWAASHFIGCPHTMHLHRHVLDTVKCAHLESKRTLEVKNYILLHLYYKFTGPSTTFSNSKSAVKASCRSAMVN